ncbi:Cell division protein FtsQ [Candidatus Terasakiella magnetica]|nr:Cell division protein FtsQ [Candidatus Terasakiella magnetica]
MRRMSSGDIIITADDRPGGAQPRRDSQAERPRGASPKAKAKRKLPRLRFDFTPLQKMATAGVMLTGLAVVCAMVWHSGLPQRLSRDASALALRTTSEAGFRISDITVAGRRRTPSDQLVMALGARYGDPTLGLDITAARARIEALPSVRAAAIERRLPGAIHLSIVERQPVALWQSEGQFVLVDRDGHQIPGAIEGFEDLPLVVGEGAPARADSLFSMLAVEPKLAGRVKAAIRVGNRRWNIKLDDVEKGLEVRLPELDSEAAWHRLAELEQNRGLSEKQITMVDMRIPDRLVLKSERDPQTAARTNTASAFLPGKEH